MNRYQEAQDIINAMAQVKMTMNAHKGKIEDCDSDVIVSLLEDEAAELAAALKEDNLMHIIEEAADVQNFLLALVQQALVKYRTRKNITTEAEL